jgi:glutamate-1-semialdehyde 2,1-aminomutase
MLLKKLPGYWRKIMNKSKELFKRARQVIPGGVNSPVRAFGSVGGSPLFIQEGKGCRIKDSDGKEYIDFVSSWGPLILGHSRQEIVEAINKTAAKGTSFGAPTELEIEMAEKIISMVPSVEMVRLVNSGTEATMSAVRLARGYTGRIKIVKFEGCYHGHGDGFLIKAGSGALTLGQPSSPGVPPSIVADTLIAVYNDLDSVQHLFDCQGAEIAAVIVEPVAGNMGVIPPAAGFLEGLRTICTANESLLIFDEVITGFRLSAGGAQEFYNVIPDLTTLGKIIGGGLPVGAYGGKKDIMETMAPVGSVYQAGTLSGNPLAVAAGLTTLQILSQDNFYVKLNKKANFFFSGIRHLIIGKNLPLSATQVASMGCLYFKEGGVSSYAEAVKSDTEKFNHFFHKMLKAGIYLAPSQFEATFISAAHTQEDLEYTLDVMAGALGEL